MNPGCPPPNGGQSERLLQAVGLSSLEERVYVALLEQPALTAAETAGLLGLTERRTRALLRALELKGMVTRSPARPVRYLPAPPDVAVDALITKRQQELYRTKLAASRLQRLARRAGGRGTGAELLEFLSGPEAVVHSLDQLQRTAQREILVFDRPPYWATQIGAVGEFELLARGVAARVIYDRAALELPGQPDQIWRAAQAGEQARVFPAVPTKLALIDGRAGLIPLDVDQPEVGALLIRAPALVDTLHLFFEALWLRATPVTFSGDGRLRLDERLAAPCPDADRLLTLLAAGLKDETIARQLGISTRTLDRRVHALMRSFDAGTRFQAGWQARALKDQTDEQG